MAERTEWILDRTEATGRGGMVAAKTEAAAVVGAAILRQGGNAIDAAVATAFAAGVVEPWMNGIGGGGYLVAHFPERGESVVVEFPMAAPQGATPEMFPLAGTGSDDALFGWPAVVDNANLFGARSVAVPGTVAGLALALERYGTLSLGEALAPAIRYAEEGFPVTWHTTLTVARDLGTLQRFPATAAVFCDAAGNPPVTRDQSRPTMLRQPDLARTLRQIAQAGPRAFYEGPVSRAIVRHLAALGAPFTEADFARYQAIVAPPVTADYRGYRVVTPGKGCGGPSLVETMNLLANLDIAGLGHNTVEALHLMAQAFRQAFADRFAYLADPDFVDVPLAALTSPEYARERAAAFTRGPLGPVRAGDRERLGVTHNLAASVPDYTSGGSTTHLGVIDRDGVAVSLTQTLLSLWGSRVVVPGTGVLLNNGMMWFDPEPGRPNSIAGGKRGLANMSPVVLTRGGQSVASLGASGGRKISNCLAQMMMNVVDHGMSIQQAITAPRIDASTPNLSVSARIPRATREALAALGHRVVPRVESPGGSDFASPVAILRDADGTLHGGADPFYPAMAIAAGT